MEIQRKTSLIPRLLIILAILAIFIGLAAGIHQFTRGHTLGWDFYYYWNSTRAMVKEGLSPYSEDTALQNQYGLYGHPATPGQDPSHFRNPLYATIPLIPFALMPYDWAQAFWMTFNILLVLLVGYLAFPSMPKWIFVLLVFFYQTAFCLIEGNYSLVSALSILVFFGVIFIQHRTSRRSQIIVGILLTASTFKPQMSWLILVWIMIYAFNEKLYPMIISFVGVLAAESVALLAFFPTWPLDFYRLLSSYQTDGHIHSVKTNLFLPVLSLHNAELAGNILLVILVCIWLLVFWRIRFSSPSRQLIVIALTALVTYATHPSGLAYEQICLLIPVIIWIGMPPQKQAIKTWTWIAFFCLSYLLLAAGTLLNDYTIQLKGPFILQIAWMLYVYFAIRNQERGLRQPAHSSE
jgi:hypothetical protein